MAKRIARLSHIDSRGKAAMVDVSDKQPTLRCATAEGHVRVSAELAAAIRANQLVKGNLLEVARLAGIQAAKRTDELIPLCHSLPLEHLQMEVWLERNVVRLKATATVTGKTGVEMEALTAVSIAALTVIDMGKAIDPFMTIEQIGLLEKSGGRRGLLCRPTPKGKRP